jgi:hypothetical protein
VALVARNAGARPQSAVVAIAIAAANQNTGAASAQNSGRSNPLSRTNSV